MFSRLRNRFLVLNLVIISVMMLLSFAAIYTITYQNVHNDIAMELGRVADFYHKPGGGRGGGGFGGSGWPRDTDGGDASGGISGGTGGGTGDNTGFPPAASKMDDGGPPPERSVSFALWVNESGDIVAVDSRFEMDEAFYTQAQNKAGTASRSQGLFKLDGNHWAYAVQADDAGRLIVYLDVTARQKILTNLVYTFAVVAAVMLIVIYFTSRYFANRSIAPVRLAFERQKQFISDASHELKTPLAVIHTNADALLANPEDTIAAQAKWLRYIKSETDRMTKLTNDLLYLTEMDESRTDPLFTLLDVSEAVESVILTMEAVAFEKQIALAYDIEPGLTVRGNSEQLRQVVVILLDNCFKYTPSGGSIEVSLKKRHNEVQLAVTNTGEGIAPEHLERIFDRFYRADKSRSRKQGGYGLGLAIAKSIVERHKGKIAARSSLDERTTFQVSLPSEGR